MKDKGFTFLFNDQERDQIYELSMTFERSQGDAVRWAVRQAYLSQRITCLQGVTLIDGDTSYTELNMGNQALKKEDAHGSLCE
jgi:hypothetical protein